MDHVRGLVVVLADGTVASIGDAPRIDAGASASSTENSRLESGLGKIRDEFHEEIQSRFPRILRSSGGYGLDRLGAPGEPVELIKILCGSEGTLAIVVAAKLNLTSLPGAKGLANGSWSPTSSRRRGRSRTSRRCPPRSGAACPAT